MTSYEVAHNVLWCVHEIVNFLPLPVHSAYFMLISLLHNFVKLRDSFDRF